jgi:hypothetical protein
MQNTDCYTCAIREKDKNRSVLLAVVPITIWSGQKRFDTFELLDTGSEITFILNHTADTLGLEGEVEMIRLGSFHGNNPLIPARNVNFSITSRDGEERFVPTTAMAVPQINFAKKRCHWPTVKLEWNHLNDLDLPTLDSSLVTVLIGRDVRGAHRTLQERCSSDDIGPEPEITKSATQQMNLNSCRFLSYAAS